MGQFTTAEETALEEAYLQFDLNPSKKPDFALAIGGWPYLYTCVSTYSLASGSHALSTTNGFSSSKVYAWMKLPSIFSSKLKEGFPECGAFAAGKVELDLHDKHGESTISRDLTELLARQAFREGNVTGTEAQLASALTKGATSVALEAGSGLSQGDTLWVGSEAILLGDKVTTTVDTFGGVSPCTRAYLLTNATPHAAGVRAYGYMPVLAGRPFWLYKGYQGLALSEWLPMWGGTIEDGYRGEPGTIRIDGRPTEWDVWSGSAAAGRGRMDLIAKFTKAANAPTHGARKIARLGQIDDRLNEDNLAGVNHEISHGGDYQFSIVTPLQAPTGLGDGHFAVKVNGGWLGIVNPLVEEIANGAGPGPGFGTHTLIKARAVKFSGNGSYPEHDVINHGDKLDFAWSNATFSATAAPVGSDPIDLLLQLLTSTGQGTNGAYDVLTRGIGLGIAVERIDLDSFTDVQAEYDYDDLTKVFFLFSEATPAKPFFDDELCKPFGWYVATGNDGRIKLVRPKNPTKLYFSRANNTFTLTQSANHRTRSFVLPGGVYTPSEAASALSTGLSTVTGATFTVSWSSSTGLFTVAVSSGTYSFTLSDAWRSLGMTSSASSVATKDGATSVGKFTETSFNTITEDDLFHKSISIDASPPRIAVVNFGCNYKWGFDEYDYKVFVDQEAANLAAYAEIPVYEIRSKGLMRAFGRRSGVRGTGFRVLLPPANNGCRGIPAEISPSIGIDASDSGATLFTEHLFDRYRNSPIPFRTKLKWKFNTREIGDCMNVDYSIAGVFADPELAADVLSDRIFEITEIKPDPRNGCVDVRLLGHRKGGV